MEGKQSAMFVTRTTVRNLQKDFETLVSIVIDERRDLVLKANLFFPDVLTPLKILPISNLGMD